MTSRDGVLGRRAYLKTSGVAGVAGLTGLAGCTLGGGGNGESGGSGGGGSDTITIGGTVPRTGQFSSLGEDLEQGYRIGVDLMNQNGGIDGQTVELILEDDESDPKKVRSNLQSITSDNDVDMLWGSFSSLLVTAGSAFAEQQEIPFVGTAFAYMAPHIEKNYRWTFAPMAKSRDVATATAGMLGMLPDDQQPTNIGIWEPNTGWGEEQSNYWDDALSSAGYDIVLRKKYSLGTQDFSTLISQSKSANVEVLLSVPTPPGAITAMKQMKSNDFSPKAVQFVRGADPNAFWSALGATGEGVTMCPGWVPGLTGNGNDTLQELHARAYDYPDDKLLPVMVGSSFNVAQVADQAFRAAGSTDPGALREALRTTTFETVLGTFGFEDNGLPEEGQLTAPIGQWREGGQHLAYPDTEGDAAVDFEYPLTPWSER
ncbi:amino acid ABC transporter substrate-binding protein [Halarchaeum nitratireducens]|uniref:amino acid ABC transporter substrate-binding protein n=1 Tax=Halarchaeum nitratireducens TaxID=489913 RepID=UPI00166CA196|nr:MULTISPECIES: amino acid ABC transporter substrate-binding protein [Halarchaeum]MBP2249836.1 branched-chain amino acid transport system substrate-binding protein [Halarchaeum solikamskense]